MQPGESFDILVRKVASLEEEEKIFRVTIFRKLESVDELLMHPEISKLISDDVVRVEKIDNFRFKIFLSKK